MALTIPLKRTPLVIKVEDAGKPIKGKFKPSNAAEAKFFKQLKKVAKKASAIVNRHAEGGTIRDTQALQRELSKYAETLKVSGWARRQSAALLKTVNSSNERAYKKHSKIMAEAMKEHLAVSNVAEVARALLEEQVALIQSIPLEAGRRAQRIAEKNFFEGTRAIPDQSVIDQLVNEMGMTEEVATNRARLIARTETARANSAFVQARATAVGSTSYIWRNSGDESVRDSHFFYHGKAAIGGTKGDKLDGKIFSWSHPVILDDGTVGYPGSFPNCRCYADPVLPDLE